MTWNVESLWDLSLDRFADSIWLDWKLRNEPKIGLLLLVQNGAITFRA